MEPTAREEVAQEGVTVAGEDRLRMELHALDRKHAVAEAHDEAVRRVCRDLQTLRQGLSLQDEAVIAGYGHGLRETLEEAATVVVDSCLMTMNGLGAHDAPTEVLADRLVSQTDTEDGELTGREPETLHCRGGRTRLSRARAQEEAGGLQGLNRGPICAVRSQHLDLCAQLREELGEVEGERVPVVEDDNHWRQDAQRGLSRKEQSKKQRSRVSRLAGAQPWNKVPE